MAPRITEPGRVFGAFGDAAKAVGTADFHRHLLGALRTLAPWDAADVVRYSGFAAPDFLHVDGLSQAVIEVYLSGFYRFDPFYHWWRERGRGAVVTLRRLSGPSDLEGEYFTGFLPRSGMVDELGVFLPSVGRTAIALFLESATKHFGQRDIARVEAAFPLFAGLNEAHVARSLADLRQGGDGAEQRAIAIIDRDGRAVFASPAWRAAEAAHPDLRALKMDASLRAGERRRTAAGLVHAEALGARSSLAPNGILLVLEAGVPALPPLDFDAAFEGFSTGRLTRRETQIARLILTGYPTDAIAKALGIGRGTVKNHRRRLYDKLDITTERELFSLFLAYLATPRPG
ncbi:MAG: LuxR C-terminal-related transcriptional regulator [Alphaproteobacteria bacterium]